MRPELVRVAAPPSSATPWDRFGTYTDFDGAPYRLEGYGFLYGPGLAGFACRYSPGHGMNVLDRFHPSDPEHHRIALASIRRGLLEQPDAVGWIGDADGGLEFYRLAVPDETTDSKPLADCIGTLIPFPGLTSRRMVALNRDTLVQNEGVA
jgi:hypothetical protein